MNQKRELFGLFEASHLFGNIRTLIVTGGQSGQLRKNGLNVEIIPAWQWLE